MIHWVDISDTQAKEAIAGGDFSQSVRTSGENVAIILTQSWCPQWLLLNRMLKSTEDPTTPDVSIHVFIYDRSDIFREFLTFKETAWQNRQIPYIRYYQQGRLVAESNFVTEKAFFKFFEGSE